MAKCKPFLQIISSELEYVPHRANVTTRELALDEWEEKWASQGRCSKVLQVVLCEGEARIHAALNLCPFAYEYSFEPSGEIRTPKLLNPFCTRKSQVIHRLFIGYLQVIYRLFSNLYYKISFLYSLISKFFLHISEDFTTFAAILTIHK